MPEENLKKYKNITIIIFLGFLILAIFYSLFFGPAKKYADSLMSPRTITVSAEGKATVSPDIAKVSFSVVSEGFNPEKIVEENNKKINKAIDFVKSQGIEEKDIKTIQYNLSPRYEYDKERKKTFISGYTLTQTILVKLRDLSRVGKILASLPELGINQIESISFDIDDPEKYLTEARNEAFEKAQEKAKEMASKNGVNLGKVINFWEYQDFWKYQGDGPIARYQEMGLGGGGVVPAMPQIQPGAQEVAVQISVTYEIK